MTFLQGVTEETLASNKFTSNNWAQLTGRRSHDARPTGLAEPRLCGRRADGGGHRSGLRDAITAFVDGDSAAIALNNLVGIARR